MGAFSLIVVINLLNRSSIMSSKKEIVDFFKKWHEQKEKFIEDLERRYCRGKEEARALDQGDNSAMENGENDYGVSSIAADDDDETVNLNHAFVQMDTNGVTILDDITNKNDVINHNDDVTDENDVINHIDDVTNDEDDDDENWED